MFLEKRAVIFSNGEATGAPARPLLAHDADTGHMGVVRGGGGGGGGVASPTFGGSRAPGPVQPRDGLGGPRWARAPRVGYVQPRWAMADSARRLMSVIGCHSSPAPSRPAPHAPAPMASPTRIPAQPILFSSSSSLPEEMKGRNALVDVRSNICSGPKPRRGWRGRPHVPQQAPRGGATQAALLAGA